MVTLSPMHWKIVAPVSQRRTKSPKVNSKPNPQNTDRHLIWAGCAEKIKPIRTKMTTPNADISLSGSSLESMIRNARIPAKTTSPKITLSNDINLGNRFCSLAMTFPKMSQVWLMRRYHSVWKYHLVKMSLFKRSCFLLARNSFLFWKLNNVRMCGTNKRYKMRLFKWFSNTFQYIATYQGALKPHFQNEVPNKVLKPGNKVIQDRPEQ